jgi:hypothetical protein
MNFSSISTSEDGELLNSTITTTTALDNESTSNIDETSPTAHLPPTELELIVQLRVALQSTLYMLEAARDNIKLLGDRMDRLRNKSQRCREFILASNDKDVTLTEN